VYQGSARLGQHVGRVAAISGKRGVMTSGGRCTGPNRTARWHLYDRPGFARSPEVVLAATESDRDGVFFG